MRVRVSDAHYLRDLILFLRECGCVAEQASETEVEAFIPDSRHERAARMEMSVYVQAWELQNEAARAEIIT